MVTLSHACGGLGLAAIVSARVDQQFGTNSHRICQTDIRGQFERRLKNWLFECA